MNNTVYYPECYYKQDSELSRDTIIEAYRTGDILVGRVSFWDNENRLLWVTFPNGFEGIIPEPEIGIAKLKYHNNDSANIPIQAQVLLGKTVCVNVIGVDFDDTDTLLLSRKQVQEQFLDTLDQGAKYHVLIKNITSFGIYVEIAVGVIALIPIKEISSTKFLNICDERINPGHLIPAIITSFSNSESNGFNIYMSYKRALHSPRYSCGDTITGIVRLPLKDKSGYFVEITPAISGIVDTRYPNGNIQELQYGSAVLCSIKGVKYITDSNGDIQTQYKLKLIN